MSYVQDILNLQKTSFSRHQSWYQFEARKELTVYKINNLLYKFSLFKSK